MDCDCCACDSNAAAIKDDFAPKYTLTTYLIVGYKCMDKNTRFVCDVYTYGKPRTHYFRHMSGNTDQHMVLILLARMNNNHLFKYVWQ